MILCERRLKQLVSRLKAGEPWSASNEPPLLIFMIALKGSVNPDKARSNK